jgi:CheY-like chemotaxis protein
VITAAEKVILLLEDATDEAILLQNSLERVGLQNRMVHVENSDLALQYLSGTGRYSDRNLHPPASIFLLDLKIPGSMDGFQMLEWIRNQPELKSLLVIVLTGNDDVKSVQRAYSLGANSYLTKPLQPVELQNMAAFFRGYFWLSAAPETGSGSGAESSPGSKPTR